jgi:hypothetical protein
MNPRTEWSWRRTQVNAFGMALEVVNAKVSHATSRVTQQPAAVSHPYSSGFKGSSSSAVVLNGLARKGLHAVAQIGRYLGGQKSPLFS